MADKEATTLPAIKQCNIIGDWQFGATATAAGPNRWLVANPDNGGHWTTDDDVKDWDAATNPAPKQPPPRVDSAVDQLDSTYTADGPKAV